MTSKLFTAPNTVTVANTMAEHGDSRDHRIEKTEGEFCSHEFSVCERFCEKCNAWGRVQGLIGTEFCPTCEIPFDKAWWEDNEKQVH